MACFLFPIVPFVFLVINNCEQITSICLQLFVTKQLVVTEKETFHSIRSRQKFIFHA